jgi:hypothetical protein
VPASSLSVRIQVPYLLYIVAGITAAGLLLALWTVVIERRLFRVRRVVLDARCVNLPPLKILHVTDTHFAGRDGAILAFLRSLAAREEFDLVFFTGDLIENAAGVESAEEAAGLFRPRLGAFAVFGGHDYATVDPLRVYTHLLGREQREVYGARNPVEELVRRLEDLGMRVLHDENVRLTAPNGRVFAIVALRDAFVFEPHFEAAWRGLDGKTPVIVIAHSPDVVRETYMRGANLAFFGHTHGGQVRLPLVGAIVTRSHLPARLASGTFCEGRTVFILNNGLGTSPVVPYRLLCRPEVTIAQVASAPSADALTRILEAHLG